VTRKWLTALAGVAMLAGGAAPLTAQGIRFSDSFTFLKAVRDRDGAKATELIDARGAPVLNSRDQQSGDSALHIVVRDRDYRWLLFLLEKGARTGVTDAAGNTPLALAASVGWTEGAEQLIARGAAVDAPNARGETPLILAVHSRSLPMARLLVQQGANPARTDSVAGYSALDYAKRDARAGPILKLLEAAPSRKAAIGPTL
jgi:uncharacterized protein